MTPTEHQAFGLLVREMRYIAGISSGQVHRIAMMTLEKVATISPAQAVNEKGTQNVSTLEQQREAFEAWWDEFSASHEDWRYADSSALRWAAWQAAQAAQPAQIPEGLKLVPVGPTVEMLTAGSYAVDLNSHSPMATWAAMLSAAPTQEQSK